MFDDGILFCHSTIYVLVKSNGGGLLKQAAGAAAKYKYNPSRSLNDSLVSKLKYKK